MLVVGLTGGLGSGKSTAAKLFSQLGITVIDADAIAHQLTAAHQPATNKIINHFGQEFAREHGVLNRRALRERITACADDRRWLEALLHPLIREVMCEALTQAKSPYSICVIPLLAESKAIDFLDRTLVIDAPESIQVARTMQRDNVPREAARALIAAQASRQQRLEIADDIIVNDQSIEDLKQAVQKMHEFYLTINK